MRVAAAIRGARLDGRRAWLRDAAWSIALGSTLARPATDGGSSPRAPKRSAAASRWRCRASLDPAFAEALGAGRRRAPLLAPAPGARGRRPPRTWSSPAAPPRASGSPSTCRSSTGSPATPSAARSTSTRPRRSPRTRRASSAELRPPGLREAIYDGDTPREERPAIRRRTNLVLTNPDMLHVGVLPHHKRWGDFLANLGWVVVDEAHTYRGVFGSHVANVLRRLRRVARAYGAEPRFLLASATIANPVELAERLVGEPFELIDDDGAPRAGREIAMWNPPLIDEATGTRRSPLSEAADLLAELVSQGVRTICFLQEPPRDRADPALRRRRAASGAAGRSWPSGSRPTAPATRPQQRREIESRLAAGRAARGGRHRRARARDRRRRARRGDLRHLPRHRRQPAADVGAGGAPPPRPRRLRRRPGRARPVLLPPPGRVPRPPGRGGDPRPRKRADPAAAPGRRRLRAAALPTRTTRSSARAGASGPSGWSAPASCAAHAAS